MPTSSHDSSGSPAASSYRLRKRWIVLALFIGCATISTWLLLRDVPLAVMQLPDGRRFTIHKLTYGTDHTYGAKPATLTSAEIWVNKHLSRIGRQISPMTTGASTYSSTVPSIYVWHSFDWSQKAPESTPHSMRVTDRHGWRSVINLSHLQNSPPKAAGQPYIPLFISLPLLSELAQLDLELLNAKGDRLAKTQVSYNVPTNLRREWTANPLPVTEADGNISLTLKDLRAEQVMVDSPSPLIADCVSVTPEIVVAVDGVESSSWVPMMEGVSFFEMLGAMGIPLGAQLESTVGATSPMSQCTLSPYDLVWKLQLPIICGNPDEVDSADRVVFERPIPFDGKPVINELWPLVQSDKAKIQLLGFGRAGSFKYEGNGEGNFPFPSFPIEGISANRLKGTIEATLVNSGGGVGFFMQSATGTARKPQMPMNIIAKFTAPRPHLIMSITETGERFPRLLVKDEKGMLLDGELFNAQGLVIWLAKETYDDVRQVDVTLLLQKPRYFTFFVTPPSVSRR